MARILENLSPEQNQQLNYLDSLFSKADLPIFFSESRAAAESLNKDTIMISAAEGRMLNFLCQCTQARHIVEIGTLTGYSALWMLWSLTALVAPKARLVSFEKDPEHARISRSILQRAAAAWWPNPDLRPFVDIIEGDAEEQLELYSAGLQQQNLPAIDCVFIDGNKGAYGQYLSWTEKNLKKSGLILADNIFLKGQVYGVDRQRFSEKQIQTLKIFNERLADSTLYASMIIPSMEGMFAARKNF